MQSKNAKTMKFEIKNCYTGSIRKGETNTLPSLTIPDETMSMREILQRYARGLPIGGDKSKQMFFEHEGEETPDFEKMDLIDKMEFQQEAMNEITAQKRKSMNEKLNKINKKSDTKSDTKEDTKNDTKSDNESDN